MLSEPPVALNKSPKGPTTEEDQHTVVNQGPVDADKELKDRIYQWLRENQDPGSETARTLKRASSAERSHDRCSRSFQIYGPENQESILSQQGSGERQLDLANFETTPVKTSSYCLCIPLFIRRTSS
mmetsp:Transcript_15314/g.41647  ORF Transcript_15314/g.41647 Transcript_15314/m.41647 type:complete len:127 (-) Transcript_15314:324-704(-)